MTLFTEENHRQVCVWVCVCVSVCVGVCVCHYQLLIKGVNMEMSLDLSSSVKQAWLLKDKPGSDLFNDDQ